MEGKLGLNGATLPGSGLLDGIRSAAAAGFSYYEPRVPELEPLRTSRASEARALLAEVGLAWLPLNGLEGVFAEPDTVLEERAEATFALASDFGVDQVIIVPGPVEGPVDRSEAGAALKRLSKQARDHGVSLLYEFIGFAHHAFPSLEEAAAVASNAGLPLVLDTFHLAVSRTTSSSIEAIGADAIGLVHLSDALVEGDVAKISDPDRVLPGEGGLELDAIVGAVLRTGFEGPISVETFHPKYGERPPEVVAREAYASATSLLDRLAGNPDT